jgi:hypothetical protein
VRKEDCSCDPLLFSVLTCIMFRRTLFPCPALSWLPVTVQAVIT